MMKKLNVLRGLLVPILFLVSLAIPGHVFAACYTSAEAEAEQAIRLHSELLVIGLNCRHFSETLHTQGTIAIDRQQAGADYQPSQEKGEERDMAPDSYFKYKYSPARMKLCSASMKKNLSLIIYVRVQKTR